MEPLPVVAPSRAALHRAAWTLSTAFLAAAVGATAFAWSAATPSANAADPAVPLGSSSPLDIVPGVPGADMEPGTQADRVFLEIQGLPGESEDLVHPGTIEVLSWSFGATQTGAHASGGGGGAGKVSMQDFHFSARVNKASPLLFHRCATGQHIKQAKLYVRKAGDRPEDYLKVTLEDVLVSSYQTGASQGAPVPTDEVSLNFAKIEYEYRPLRADGTLGDPVRVRYDVKAGR